MRRRKPASFCPTLPQRDVRRCEIWSRNPETSSCLGGLILPSPAHLLRFEKLPTWSMYRRQTRRYRTRIELSRGAPQMGFADLQPATLLGSPASRIRSRRRSADRSAGLPVRQEPHAHAGLVACAVRSRLRHLRGAASHRVVTGFRPATATLASARAFVPRRRVSAKTSRTKVLLLCGTDSLCTDNEQTRKRR